MPYHPSFEYDNEFFALAKSFTNLFAGSKIGRDKSRRAIKMKGSSNVTFWADIKREKKQCGEKIELLVLIGNFLKC